MKVSSINYTSKLFTKKQINTSNRYIVTLSPPKQFLLFKNATIIHSLSKNSIEYLLNIDILINLRTGIIEKMSNTSNFSSYVNNLISKNIVEIYSLKSYEILIPGFIDTHVHAPQYAFAGNGLDLPLLEW